MLDHSTLIIKYFFIFVSIISLSPLCQAKDTHSAVAEIRYWDWGNTPIRDNYQYELLGLVLEKSKSKYGHYELKRIAADYTTARVRRELSRGQILNVQIGPWRPASVKGLDPAIRIERDLYNGLLGYRKLIVRKEDADLYSEINSLQQLKRYSAGVGKGWVDSEIFLSNGFRINSGTRFNTLVPMLKAKRFDFLSLSVIEADEVVARADVNYSVLVAQQPYLFMPLPFVFYVSVKEPELAKRIEYGLHLAIEDGSFDALFQKTFASVIANIKDNKEKFLYLKNNQLPEYMQIQPIFLIE